jgi:L-fuconate dehydratase
VFGISLIDYIAVSGTMDSRGRYNVPTNPDEGYRYFRLFLFLVSPLTGAYSSIEMHKSSIAEYQWPNGTYWQSRRAEIASGN